jgi:hypothetical protein
MDQMWMQSHILDSIVAAFVTLESHNFQSTTLSRDESSQCETLASQLGG